MPAMSTPVALASAVLVVAAVATVLGSRDRGPSPALVQGTVASGAVIAGRVVDAGRLVGDGVEVRVGKAHGGDYPSRHAIRPAADGTFVTPPLPPGPYVLELVRTRKAPTNGNLVGFQVVRLGTADVSGVSIDVRRDTAITGRFRMVSDHPNAAWPEYIGVTAYSVIAGAGRLTRTSADGAPGGTFVLRNAFGPRVLRCAFLSTPGSRWWMSRVMLNGQDVTNVPTDFSRYPDGRLEIVFTQHPARITGTVVDDRGRPLARPWITAIGTDAAATERWATTAVAWDGDTEGRFAIEVPPGVYRVDAAPRSTYEHLDDVLVRMPRTSTRGVVVSVAERETQTVTLRAPAAAASP
jgi:hypothetical protein